MQLLSPIWRSSKKRMRRVSFYLPETPRSQKKHNHSKESQINLSIHLFNRKTKHRITKKTIPLIHYDFYKRFRMEIIKAEIEVVSNAYPTHEEKRCTEQLEDYLR